MIEVLCSWRGFVQRPWCLTHCQRCLGKTIPRSFPDLTCRNVIYLDCHSASMRNLPVQNQGTALILISIIFSAGSEYLLEQLRKVSFWNVQLSKNRFREVLQCFTRLRLLHLPKTIQCLLPIAFWVEFSNLGLLTILKNGGFWEVPEIAVYCIWDYSTERNRPILSIGRLSF